MDPIYEIAKFGFQFAQILEARESSLNLIKTTNWNIYFTIDESQIYSYVCFKTCFLPIQLFWDRNFLFVLSSLQLFYIFRFFWSFQNSDN